MKFVKIILIVLTGVFLFSQVAFCVLAPPDYPRELTRNGWKKNKGIIAKIVQKDTGIGNLLGDCETKFNAIDWKKLQGGPWMVPLISEHGKKAVAVADKTAMRYHADKVAKFQAALQRLEETAKALAVQWKTSRKIPKASRKYVETISQKADEFFKTVSWNNLGAYRETFDAFYKDVLERMEGAMLVGLKKMRTGIKKVKAKGEESHTLSDKEFFQPFRTFFAFARKIPELEQTYGPYVNDFLHKVPSWGQTTITGTALVAACEEAMEKAEAAYNDYQSLKR